MYSQYQASIYGGGGGGAVNTNNNSSNNNGYVWNGSHWVLPSSGATTSSSTGSQSNNTTVDPRVTEYTEYYHQYKELEKRYQGEPKGTQWAKYNADECSRAAHFFHQNPFGTPPFPLPSPPPQVHLLGTTTTTNSHNNDATAIPTAKHTSSSEKSQNSRNNSNNNNSNDGLKRYFDRCLKQCTGADAQQQKAWVSKAIQEEITRAVQTGTLHSIDWDTKPILTYPQKQQQQQQPVPAAAAAAAAASSSSSYSYYGPTPASTTTIKTQQQQQPQQESRTNSYYGPTVSNSKSSSKQQKQQQLMTMTIVTNQDTSYYGPSLLNSMATDNLYRKSLGNNSNIQHPESTTATEGGGGGPSDPSNYSYYGPSSTNVPPTATADASKVIQKWNSSSITGKNKVPKQKRKSGVTNDNYYGPTAASTESFESNIQGHDGPDEDNSDDFISLSWYHDKLKKKSKDGSGKRKRENRGAKDDDDEQGSLGGFDLTKSAMKKRANRFAEQGRRGSSSSSVTYAETTEQWDRYMGKTTIGGGHKKKLDESDYEKMTIKGTCETLEKAYLRLTAPPRPELVRPQHILEKHLANLQLERENRPDNSSGHDYLWFCSQLKAIRQDCTVQRIQNAFTVDVYEMHARIALEESDMNEYNQCQTQLKELYVLLEKMGGEEAEKGLQNRDEFTAYRLIYYVFLSLGNNKHGGSSEVVNILLSLTNEQKLNPMIKYALAVREACYNDDILDYHAFFLLRQRVPTIGVSHLIENLVSPMRYKALLRICKGYRPMTIAVDFVLQELGFATEAEWDFGVKWLRSCGCILSEDDKEIVTKETVVHESKMEEKQSLI
jgi:hypothetical protein